MKKALLVAVFAPCLLTAGMKLFVVKEGAELPVGEFYDVGSVAVGNSVDTAFRVRNSSASKDWLQGLNLAGSRFSFASLPQLPIELASGAEVEFAVRFYPLDTGSYSAYLNINGVRTVLMGTARLPEFPQPQIAVEPEALGGGQQAKVAIRLASISRDSGSGELSMEFIPSVPGKDDPAVLFPATGGRSISFTVSAGEDTARFDGNLEAEFQTGTTAGSIVFTARLGPHTEQLTVSVPSALVVVDTASLTRVSQGLEVQVTGFDTSRSTNLLFFTFFDSNAQMVAPGKMQVNVVQPFQQYFATTDFGGIFTLRAVFGVRGDVSRIGAVEVELVNSLGSTRTARVPIQQSTTYTLAQEVYRETLDGLLGPRPGAVVGRVLDLLRRGILDR